VGCFRQLKVVSLLKAQAMKKILLLFLIILMGNCFAQRSLLLPKHPSLSKRGATQKRATQGYLMATTYTCLYDSIQSSNWDTTNNVWINHHRYIYTYDANGQILTGVVKSWVGTSWVNSDKIINTISSGKIINKLSQGWGGVWINSSQDIITFSGNNMINELFQNWNGTSWDNSGMNTNTYFGSNLINHLEQKWNGTVWENLNQNTFIYSGNNMTGALFTMWDSIAATWDTLSRETFTYVNNNMITDLAENFNSGVWSNAYMVDYVYNINDVVDSSKDQEWNGGAWDLAGKDNFMFCTNNICYSYEIGQSWTNNIWVNSVKWDYFGCTPFPICASVIDSIYQDTIPHTWDVLPNYSPLVDSAKWSWGDGTYTIGLYPSHVYTSPGWYNICVTAYSSCGDSATYCQNDSVYKVSNSNSMIYVNILHNTNDVKEIASDGHDFSIYPNPTTGVFTIETQSKNPEIKITNLIGEEIQEARIKKQETKTEIDLNAMQNGIYFVNIKTNEGLFTKKIVVQH
jgi:hypothetical protein